MSHAPFPPYLRVSFVEQVQIERSLLSAETAWQARETPLLPYVAPRFTHMSEMNSSFFQPADYLPDPAGEGFIDELTAMRECAASLPDELLVVLVGDMITEEALPTYMSLLNTLEGCNDVTGTGESAWARCVFFSFSQFFKSFFCESARARCVFFSLTHTHPILPPICSHSPFFSSTSAEIRLLRAFGRVFSREAHSFPICRTPILRIYLLMHFFSERFAFSPLFLLHRHLSLSTYISPASCVTGVFCFPPPSHTHPRSPYSPLSHSQPIYVHHRHLF